MQDHKLELHLDEYLPLRDLVFRTLRQAILTGELKPGERLMEIHLANRLGVSRTPVREAIRMLELEGLVTMIPRRGAEVSRISRQDISDVLEVRGALDSLAVRLACERISEEETDALKAAAESFRQAVATGDLTAVADADVAFHDLIIAASKNRQLMQMAGNLAERVYRYRLEYIKDTHNHANLIKEHDQILHCILERRTDQALEAILAHVDHQEQAIISQLDGE
ncbi:MAG: GntR family transcriptional regulator [Lachnospiraceae bacterium]|nr:GntR family transcriptional regulator [Lachnospiraceae bacterium]MCR5268493.1 GntR family transcriptional regulator [Lachnospiraceae bacterium]